ncbi:MAG: hypothetical protein EHM49_00455 [Deltaproteobacteria bacterium]|nr:MAG: hypothetical protein EHM49_00455 [Deltaproteobacteria bacterium]
MNTLIIDGNNLCYKALIIRGTREMMGVSEAGNYNKEIVLSVISGFLSQILRLAERYDTNQFIFAWDTKPYHRNKLFPKYKSKDAIWGRAQHERREDMKHIQKWGPPPHLKEPVFKLLKEMVLPKIGFRNIFWKVGFEADDIIASLVNTYSKDIAPESLIVVSSDKDLYQLLDKCTTYSISHAETTKKIFMNEYPFPPKVWPIYRAIVGDISDAIPGVPGMGPAFTKKFITKTLKTTSSAYQTLMREQNRDIVRRNLKLMTLPWPGVGTFSLKKDELSFPAFIDLVNRLAIKPLLATKNTARWKAVLS